MKTLKQTIKVIIVGIVLLTLSLNFVMAQKTLESQKQLIIGTWISDGNTNARWVFIADDVLKRYDDGKLYKTYNYTISTETSETGLVFYFLDLVNINDSEDKYAYEFSVYSKKLTVIYLGGISYKPTRFTRE